MHGNHSAAFYELMAELTKQYETLRDKGVVLDAGGMPIVGGRWPRAPPRPPRPETLTEPVSGEPPSSGELPQWEPGLLDRLTELRLAKHEQIEIKIDFPAHGGRTSWTGSP